MASGPPVPPAPPTAPHCPGPRALEHLALNDDAGPGVREHVGACAVCRQSIEDIRENQRFLEHAGAVLSGAIDAANAEPASAAEPSVHDAVPGYELHEEVARGGQGVVYRAVQEATRRPAAVKVLLSGSLASSRQRRRFEREIEIAANLRHRNLVTVFGSGENSAGRPYVAMEFVKGAPIDRFVEEKFGEPGAGERGRVNAIVRLVADVAAGVGHAHAAGVIHRDLKPSNILVEDDGTPRVLDFGLARAAEAPLDVSVTQEFVGTPAYASPEQLGGDASLIGTPTDVYALGLVLYRLLTGRHPYPCDGAFVTVAAHARDTEPARPSRYVPRLSTDVETIVLKCLAKDPTRRYPNAAALASDIDDYLQGRPISARRDSTAYVLRKLALRHRTATLAGGLVVITVVAAAVGLAMLAQDLDVTRRDAEARLASSEVLRGRLMAGGGAVERAESMFWGQAIRDGLDTSADDFDTDESAAAHRLRWALMEFYSRVPCRMRTMCDQRQHSLGFGPDDSVWAIDHRGSRRTWARDGRLLHHDPVASVKDGEQLVTTSHSGRIGIVRSSDSLRIVEMESERTLVGPTPVHEFAAIFRIAEDGSFAATIDREGPGAGTVTFLDGATLAPVASFPQEHGHQLVFTTSPDGALQCIVGTNLVGQLSVLVHQGPDWRVVRTIPMPEAVSGGPELVRVVNCIEGTTTLIAGVGASLVVVDLGSSAPARVLRHLASPITRLAAVSGNGAIAAGQEDGTIDVVSLHDGSILRSFDCEGAVLNLAYNPARETLGVDSAGGVRVFELSDPGWLERLSSTPSTHADMAIALDDTLAWGDDDGKLHIKEAGSLAITSTDAHRGVITSVDFSPDGSEILTSGQDGSLRCWRRDGTPIRTLASGLPQVWCTKYSPDGRTIAACGDKGLAWLWSDGGNRVTPIEAGNGHNRLPKLAFSPNGRFVAIQSTRDGTSVWDAASGERVLTIVDENPTAVRAITYSPDGRFIATGGDDRSVCVWDAKTGSLHRRISGLPWGPFDLAFHPSGRVLFVVGPGGQLVALDPLEGEELATLDVHVRPVFSVGVSRDGMKIFTSGEDPWIGIVDLSSLAGSIRGNENYWRERLATDSAGAR